MKERPPTETRDNSSVDVLVLGGASTDFVAYGATLPGAGDELVGNIFCELPGGKGANQAVAVARLGARAGLVARVGADTRGDAILHHLQREGVDTRSCRRDPDEPTGAILLMVNHEGTKQTLTVPGATGRLSTDDFDEAIDGLAQAQLLLVQFEAPRSTVLHAIASAHQLGRRVLLDAAPPTSVPDEVWEQIYLIRANAREASVLAGCEVHDADTARHAAKRFFDRGVQVAAIQAGAEGNILIWHGGEVLLPPIEVNMVDKTAAGDAFIAALAVALLEEQPWTDAGWFANAAAALATTRLGAEPGIPRRHDVTSLLDELRG